MMYRILILLILLPISVSLAMTEKSLPAGKVYLHIPLTVGSFEINGTVSGYGKYNKKGILKTSKLKVDCNSLSSDNGLRDKHVKERLLCNKHPIIFLSKVKGLKKSKVAKGILTVKGIPKEFKTKYYEDGKKICASGKVNIRKDYKITDASYLGVGVKDEIKIIACVPLKS